MYSNCLVWLKTVKAVTNYLLQGFYLNGSFFIKVLFINNRD